MSKTMPIAALLLAAISLAATAALVNDQTESSKPDVNLTSAPAGSNDWNRRGTRSASAAMQQTSPGAVIDLPRRGERSPYQTVADNAMQTPDDWLRRGSR
jgi:hypothetical protein